MISWEIPELDVALGGLKEHALTLVHEVDPRSRGKELLYHIMKRKLEKGSLVGYFNISYPIHVLLEVSDRMGISLDGYLKSWTLAIIDTFGSFYDIALSYPGVWYLKGSLSAEVLPAKYAEVVERHKRKWAELGLFDGREIFGFAIDMSDYLELLGGEKETLKYLELSAEVRANSRAYRKYPRGTNFWFWSGMKSVSVLESIYRRADYVLRTSSEIRGKRVIRTLEVIKTPEPRSEILRFHYEFRNGEPIVREL
ncbi:hypothetical protein FH039_02135 [Thermococcus indicus]|uniref:Uncharacterized protein n=1 Tax=Thermococcus indicus TaxID=2586643 RepID=A0A4Y5SKE1_9EURY|nr:hypothetical protein [Thermococcus indicus]QDA30652.1 hypothetical protein FH039_02135 [Thermococcus indicus]